MAHKKLEVIDGYNNFIESQKKGLHLQKVSQMTVNDYRPIGSTALYDSIRVGVNNAHINKKTRVILVIMTNGEDNSSRNTNMEQVREIITQHEARGDWTFVYIGEGVDKWVQNSSGKRLNSANSAQYSDGTHTQNFQLTSNAISQFRSSSEDKCHNLFESRLSPQLCSHN